MATVATICARGGSRGVPGKNIRDLLGKPLIAHTIEQALLVEEIDRVFVSTDDPRIARVAREAGAEVPFIRPAELATDQAAKLPVIRHLVEHVEGDIGKVERIVDLDPTSPLRALDDIRASLRLLDKDTDMVITGYEAEKNPYFNMVEEQPDGNIGLVAKMAGGVVARQAAPKVYSMNGSVYVWHRHTLRDSLWEGRIRLHVMPRERSVDIDAPLDFRIVEMLMREAKGNFGC